MRFTTSQQIELVISLLLQNDNFSVLSKFKDWHYAGYASYSVRFFRHDNPTQELRVYRSDQLHAALTGNDFDFVP